MKGWNTKHLRSGGWYLDLLMTQVLEEEKELYEYCKHEEENSTKGAPRRKVDVDVVEEIWRALKNILVNLILITNKGNRQLKPHPYAQRNASNFIAFVIANETQSDYLVTWRILQAQMERSCKEPKHNEEVTLKQTQGISKK